MFVILVIWDNNVKKFSFVKYFFVLIYMFVLKYMKGWNVYVYMELLEKNVIDLVIVWEIYVDVMVVVKIIILVIIVFVMMDG